MAEHILKTIEDIKRQLEPLEKQMVEKRRFINQLCELAGIPPMYSDDALATTSSAPTFAIKPDQFFGRPLATVAREYLEMRKTASLGPATLDEVFNGLLKGGFDFQGSGEDGKKNGLSISLAKNNAVFVKVPPNDSWGLAAWYGIKPRSKKDGNGNDASKPGADKATQTNGQPEEEKSQEETTSPVTSGA